MKKRLALLLLCACMLPFVSSCSPKNEPAKTEQKTEAQEEKTSTKKEPTNGKTRTVKDADKKEIAIPENVQKVAPTIGAFQQVTCMLGAQEKVVAGVKTKFEFFKKVYPKANPENRNVDNMEELVASGAEVVYGPRITEEQAKNIEKAGIKYVKLDAFSTPEELKSCISTIATILGEKEVEQYKKFEKFYDDALANVSNKTKDAKKVTVLSLMDRNGTYSTINATDINNAYIEAAGGKNVSADFKGEKSKAVPQLIVGKEQIISWNPEIILISTQSGKENLLKDPQLQTMDAVKNKKVYVVPTGTYLWSVRSGEGALMPYFLTKTFHPDLFKDLMLENEVKKFYKEFSNYDLTDAEVKEILAGQK